MRLSVPVCAALATILSLTINSIYTLFILCDDLVYVILFPQFVCVMYVPVSNTYGSLISFLLGYLLRLAAGEPALKIPALLKYPLFDVIDGVPTQLFPFRTLTMLISLCTIILVSILTSVVFKHGYLDKKWDVFKCVVNTDEPIDNKDSGVKLKGSGETKEAEGDESHTVKEGNLNPALTVENAACDTRL